MRFRDGAPTAPSAITVPAKVNGGSTVTIEWTAASDAENNLEGYLVERSTDGGDTWTQIYQGSARSATSSVAWGLDTVMYRVRAYDAEELYSGWRTSGQVAVSTNTAPTVPDGIPVPEAVNGNQLLTIASAILDRVLHHCTIINIKGESYRLKERKEFMRQKQQIVNTLFEQGNA